nr:sugar ABC transporter substrate-binding protein [uncultured Sphaerochaeta sp.]
MRKIMIILCIALLIPGYLFANGGSEKSGSTGKSEEKITLDWTFWATEKELDIFARPAIEEFEKQNPNIHINLIFIANTDYFKQLAVDIATNNEADIVTLDTGDGISAYYNIRKGGAFIPLDDYMKGYVLDDGTELEKIDLIDSVKKNGQVVALPWFTFAAPVTIYRKSVLEKAGVDPAELSASWDSYYKAAKKLTKDTNGDGKTDIYGFSHQTEGSVLLRWWTMHWLWENGGGIFPKEEAPYTADNLIWNSKENIEATEFLKKMITECGPSGKYTVNDALNMFANGSVATMQATTWCFANLKAMMNQDDYENDIGLAYFPNNGDKTPVNVTWGNPLAISSNSEHPEEAFKFIAFMHGKYAQSLQTNVPVNQEARAEYAKKNPYQAKTLDMVLEGELRQVPDIVQWRELDNIVNKSLEDAFLGAKSIKDALDWGQKEMQAVMSR